MVPVIFGDTQRENQCLFFVGIYIKALDYNGFPTATKVEAPPGTDANCYEAKRYCPNSYAYVIGMMMYLASNIRPYISFDVHQCDRFTHNTKASQEKAVRRVCRYIQGTKTNSLVLIHPINW